jgi:hypothetical protein
VNSFNLFPSTRNCVIQNKSIGLHGGYDGDNGRLSKVRIEENKHLKEEEADEFNPTPQGGE